VRFLPEYDNVLLSHADRGRFYVGGYRTPPRAGKGGFVGGVLVDGMFRATYTLTRGRDRADLLVTPFGRFSTREEDALAEEGSRLLAFVVSGTDHDVRLGPPE